MSEPGAPLTRSLLPPGSLPDASQYKFTFNFSDYDGYPFNIYSPEGFRPAMEGSINQLGFGGQMHNQVGPSRPLGSCLPGPSIWCLPSRDQAQTCQYGITLRLAHVLEPCQLPSFRSVPNCALRITG